MTRVMVRMYATVRDASGTPSCEAEANDLATLLEELKERFGRKFTKMIGAEGAVGDNLVILVNGRNVDITKGMTAKLRDGDEVSIFPPVSGG